MAKLIVRMVIGFLIRFRLADEVIETLIGKDRVVVDKTALEKLNKFVMDKLKELPSDVAWASGQVRQDMAAKYPRAPYGYCDSCGKPLDESSHNGYPCRHCGTSPGTMEKVVRYEIVQEPPMWEIEMFPVYEREETEQDKAPAVTNPEDLLTLTVDRAAIIDALAYLKGSAGGWPMGNVDGTPVGRLYQAMEEALASK